jgi:hypothetical protein
MGAQIPGFRCPLRLNFVHWRQIFLWVISVELGLQAPRIMRCLVDFLGGGVGGGYLSAIGLMLKPNDGWGLVHGPIVF